mmetsp:Transcript_120349/g.190693  ORF Transcript_120349/g.190693 Transcript_120349/m.190693 type:complete len:545 (-) Transcript_120349:41-1675(-)
MASHEAAWCLLVQYPNREQVQREIPVPQSLEDLRTSLGIESGQTLLTSHPRHADQQFAVERLEQLQNGSAIVVSVPRRRIYISMPPHIHNKAVIWYPGSTVDQIEKAIAKAAGFSAGTAIELRDGEATVVLSTTIPNDTHLEIRPYAEEPPLAPAPVVQAAPAERARRPAPAPQGSSTSLPQEARGLTAKNLQQSPSNRSVSSSLATSTGGLRRERSPQRNTSPQRARSPTSQSIGTGSTTPAAHQSAPEEHCAHILAGHTGFIFCLCSVGDILFTGSQDSNIMIWDLNNLQYIGTLPGHRGFVRSLTASYAKKILASGSQDRTIRIWSLDSFSTAKTLYGHTGGVHAVLILESNDALVSGSEDRSIRVWDLQSYEAIASIDQAHLGGIFALERFGSPLQVVSGARDRSLKVWDASSWSQTRQLHPPHYDGVTSIAVSHKHGKFYSGSRDRSIKEWDVNTLTNTMHTLHVHGDWVQALCMSASEDILFSGSRDSTVKVWDGDLQCQDILQGHRGPVSALVTVGNRLFSASHDRTVRVWRIEHYG